MNEIGQVLNISTAAVKAQFASSAWTAYRKVIGISDAELRSHRFDTDFMMATERNALKRLHQTGSYKSTLSFQRAGNRQHGCYS